MRPVPGPALRAGFSPRVAAGSAPSRVGGLGRAARWRVLIEQDLSYDCCLTLIYRHCLTRTCLCRLSPSTTRVGKQRRLPMIGVLSTDVGGVRGLSVVPGERIPRTPIEWPVDRPLLPPGKGVKFAVVDSVTGNRSSTWLVRTSRNKDDVYLLELRTGGTWKVSHHNEGGIWRIAETSEAATSVKSKREVVDHWHWPSPEHGGWREGVGVLIPSVYLRPDPDPLPPSVVQIPRFAEHAELAVKLLFEDRAPQGAFFRPASPSRSSSERTTSDGYTCWLRLGRTLELPNMPSLPRCAKKLELPGPRR